MKLDLFPVILGATFCTSPITNLFGKAVENPGFGQMAPPVRDGHDDRHKPCHGKGPLQLLRESGFLSFGDHSMPHTKLVDGRPQTHQRGGSHHKHHTHHRKSFFYRLHRALTSLGLWGGGAVAFVLGELCIA